MQQFWTALLEETEGEQRYVALGTNTGLIRFIHQELNVHSGDFKKWFMLHVICNNILSCYSN